MSVTRGMGAVTRVTKPKPTPRMKPSIAYAVREFSLYVWLRRDAPPWVRWLVTNDSKGYDPCRFSYPGPEMSEPILEWEPDDRWWSLDAGEWWSHRTVIAEAPTAETLLARAPHALRYMTDQEFLETAA